MSAASHDQSNFGAIAGRTAGFAAVGGYRVMARSVNIITAVEKRKKKHSLSLKCDNCHYGDATDILVKR